MRAEKEVAWVPVAPLHPGRRAEESLAVDRVEGVGEVNLQEHRGRVLTVPFAPLSRSVQTQLGALRLGNVDLEREKVVTRWPLNLITESLSSEPSPGISNRITAG